MAQITIEVPERLGERLDEVKARLSKKLALWPEPYPPPITEVYGYVLKFLVNVPSPAAVLKFKMTKAMRERISELLEKNREEKLTPTESAELDEYGHINRCISLLKARALRDVHEAPTSARSPRH
jgi:hypothetical protein